MSQEADKDQKTEQPTPKRLADAAKEGDVLQSKEFGTALIMAAGAAWLLLAGSATMEACKTVLRRGLSFDHQLLDGGNLVNHGVTLLYDLAFPVASLFGLTIIAALAGPVMLGSVGFRAKAFAPKGSKINPVNGLKRIFGPHGLMELGKSLAKASLLGTIGYYLISTDVELMISLAGMSLDNAISKIGWSVLTAIVAMTAGLAVIALVDVPVQAMMRNKKLRMTKQQVKDEGKETEGSPEAKSAMRQRRHEVLSRSARQAVQDATVILTNPTHFAVALRYRPGEDAAPTVVGKGCDEMAAAIRELAMENDVPMLSYPELTRAIYFTSKVGQEVAEDLYVAVARILAFVFNLDKAMAQRVAQPIVNIPGAFRFNTDGKKLN